MTQRAKFLLWGEGMRVRLKKLKTYVKDETSYLSLTHQRKVLQCCVLGCFPDAQHTPVSHGLSKVLLWGLCRAPPCGMVRVGLADHREEVSQRS